jgi:hypothetical protein
MNAFRSLPEYEHLLYTLQDRHAAVIASTLIIVRRGPGVAIVSGEVHVAGGRRLTVREVLTWDSGRVSIRSYGYEAWQGGEKIYWYDSQPHPNEPELASTAPHHKHISPDIKRHRVRAPELSFAAPNIPFLIDELTRWLETD